MKLQQHCTLEMNTYDDFLDEDYHQELLSILTGWEFPWFYQNTLTAGSQDVSALGFNHWLKNDTDPEFSELIAKMQDKVGAKECYRARCDMTMYNPKGYRHDFHTDAKHPHRVCIYYVNDSDGDTIIMGEDNSIHRVTPKANKMITFNGKHLHTGHSPQQHKCRILINANYSLN